MGPPRVRYKKNEISLKVIETLLEIQKGLRQDAELFKDIGNILVDYYPEQKCCEKHGTKLLLLKTDTRGVRSIEYPPLTVRKIYLYCPRCKQDSEKTGDSSWNNKPEVPLLSRGKSPFSMDVIAKTGMVKFLGCKRRDEVQDTLIDKDGVYASDGAITTMGKEFLVRVKCLHFLRFDRLVEDIIARGGYICGIDGTGDGGSDRIFVAMDLVRDWVLISARIPSETVENMAPHLKFLKEKLGLPLANVCDMFSSMMNVLRDIMVDVLLRVCHYHFIGDIGKDLMKNDYLAARKLIIDTKLETYLKRLRKMLFHKSEEEGIDISRIAKELRAGKLPPGMPVEVYMRVLTYDTISWMLRYRENDEGMRFPYTLPFLNFYKRCQEGLKKITIIRESAAKGRTSPKYLRMLESTLRENVEDRNENTRSLRNMDTTVRESYALFEELREILRIPKDKGDIPRDKLIIESNEMLTKMKEELEEFRERLREKAADGKHPKEKIIVDHLDKYWSNIILENVVVNINGEDVVIEIPRTTSGNETHFGMLKGDIRKRQGKKNIGRELNMYGDYLSYVQNLKSESYVALMFGSLNDLAKAFEEIPPEMVKREMELLHKEMRGYDITNTGLRDKNIELADIMNGVKVVKARIEEVLHRECFRPPEIFGRQSNGMLTL